MVLHAATVIVLPPPSDHQKESNRVRSATADERLSKKIKIVIVSLNMTHPVCPAPHTAALGLPREAGASRDNNEGLLLQTVEGAALH